MSITDKLRRLLGDGVPTQLGGVETLTGWAVAVRTYARIGP